jgi:hypothetical protein
MTAKSIVAQRAKEYGQPAPYLSALEEIWTIMDVVKAGSPNHVDGVHPALKMIVMKALRLCHTPDHLDSLVDIEGYKICIEECLKNGKRSG